MSNEGEYNTGPKDLITEEALSAALKADKGESAYLRSWQVRDFVKKGTNYMFYVTSVVVRYTSVPGEGDEGETTCKADEEVTYVLKLNPRRNVQGNNTVLAASFYTEEGFYMKIAPRLNSVMEQAGFPRLNIPNCYYSCKEEGKQMVIMEDLRHRGYRAADYSVAIEERHRMLVLRNLARFHASFHVFKKIHPEEDLKKWINIDTFDKTEYCGWMDDVFGKGIDLCYNLAKQTEGFEKARKWLEKRKESPSEILLKLLFQRSGKFDTMSHGDMNPNNLPFRYDGEGNPVDVMFVDLQGAAFRSPNTDLCSHLYLCTPGSVRRQNRAKYLSIYYEAFKTVLEAVDEEMPFTLEELTEDFKKHLPFGFILFMVGFQFVIEPIDVDDFYQPRSSIDQGKLAKKVAYLKEKRPEMFEEVFRVFGEMEEDGVFDE